LKELFSTKKAKNQGKKKKSQTEQKLYKILT